MTTKFSINTHNLFLVAVTALLLSFTAKAQSETAEVDPRIQVIMDYYTAYGTGDLENLRPFFAEDIVWRIPGQHPLAGDKVGADEVLAFFAELGKGGFGAEPIAFAVDPNTGWVIDLHRGFSTEGEGVVDTTWALAFRVDVENRQILEAINFSFDQAAANAYFWANYPLLPLPERLAEPATPAAQ
jgi:uncharacterized protein